MDDGADEQQAADTAAVATTTTVNATAKATARRVRRGRRRSPSTVREVAVRRCRWQSSRPSSRLGRPSGQPPCAVRGGVESGVLLRFGSVLPDAHRKLSKLPSSFRFARVGEFDDLVLVALRPAPGWRRGHLAADVRKRGMITPTAADDRLGSSEKPKTWKQRLIAAWVIVRSHAAAQKCPHGD